MHSTVGLKLEKSLGHLPSHCTFRLLLSCGEYNEYAKSQGGWLH